MVMVPSLRRSRIWIETHGEECLSIAGSIVLDVVMIVIVVIVWIVSNCMILALCTISYL